MVYILLFLIIFVVSGMVVRGGALALRMTGVPWNIALFQSVSAYTRTGFTTKEAEMVIMDPLRRNIITNLIYLGNAGIASFAVTVINASGASYNEGATEKTVYTGIILIILFFLNYLLFSKHAFEKFDTFFEASIKKKFLFTNLRATQVASQKTGYGLALIPVEPSYPICGKSLKELDFSCEGIILLGIKRGEKYMPLPATDEKIIEKDQIIVYGNYKTVDPKIYSQEALEFLQSQYLQPQDEK